MAGAFDSEPAGGSAGRFPYTSDGGVNYDGLIIDDIQIAAMILMAPDKHGWTSLASE